MNTFETFFSDESCNVEEFEKIIKQQIDSNLLHHCSEIIDNSLEDEIESLISERNSAREAKDWSKSDSIRDRLHSMGIEIQDTPDGTKWRRI